MYRELGYNKSKFCHDKFQMSIHIHSYTPNDLVYGETDRFPITLNSAVRCICGEKPFY